MCVCSPVRDVAVTETKFEGSTACVYAIKKVYFNLAKEELLFYKLKLI